MEMMGEQTWDAGQYWSVPATQRITLLLSVDQAKRMYRSLIAGGDQEFYQALELLIFEDRAALAEAWNRGDVTSRSMKLTRD